ncbi:stage III sporulation protein AE [Paenibacillus sp. J31TS4]|nr:stage III sporulation protein AE [Paenibacillus sp. J31TS4]GIP37613.1 stage III sporulation protein AE [Paenibacillus sp. J31TS4]
MKPTICRTFLLLLLLLTASVLGASGPAVLAAEAASRTAGPADTLVQEQAERLPTDEVEQYWDRLMKEYGGYLPESKTPSFAELLLGNGSLSLGALLKGLLKYLFHEIIVNSKLLGTIVVLTVFSMILETLQSAFEKQAVSKVAFAISYLVLIVIAVNSFSIGIGYAKEAITEMIQFMVAVVPLLLTLLASMGNVTTVAVLHPLIIFMIYTLGTAIYTVVFPLLFFSVILHIVSSISERYKVTQLANLMRSGAIGLLGLFVTVFLGVVSVQGMSGGIRDGVTLRTAKFIAGNFVPVVGRMFSDASDTVIGASLLVKNAVGLAGVVIIIILCAFPAIKILTLSLIYNGCAAVLQPLGNSPIIGCLQTIGKSMIYVFAALAAVGLMFFLAITIMIAAGNVSVMMR